MLSVRDKFCEVEKRKALRREKKNMNEHSSTKKVESDEHGKRHINRIKSRAAGRNSTITTAAAGTVRIN